MHKQSARRLRSGGKKFRLPATVFVLSVACLLSLNRAFADEPPFVPAESIDESDEAYYKELEKSADEISARELNECHLAMIGRLIYPSDIKLQLMLGYGGLVTDPGTTVGDNAGLQYIKRSHVKGQIGHPLNWHVSSHKSALGIFSISISVRKTDMTVAELPLKKRTLYVNIFGAEKENREELTKKRDDLGGESILEFVKRLEKEPSDLETPEAN